jgi:hypothetical protein
MQFGSAVGSLKELRERASSGGPQLITFIPDESKGTLKVRFLTEPEEWVGYREIYDPIKRKSWPVPPDDTMPGTPEEDTRVSKRFLANAVEIDSDRVIAVKLPATLVEQLIIRYDRFSTILDRDYILGRSGQGVDTTYYCDPEPPTRMKTDKYNLLDLNGVLTTTYEGVWGVTNNSAPATAAKGPRRPKTPIGITPAVDDDEESPVEDLDELAQLADDEDSAEAAATLTSLADDMGVDPEQFDTWIEVVEAIKAGPSAEPEAEDAAEETEDDSEQSFASMGVVIDDDNADEELAQEYILLFNDACAKWDIDADDYDTWEDVGTRLDELEANGSEAEAEASTEEAEDDDAETETWSEDDLKGKQIGELRALARDKGINTSGLNKAALVEALTGGSF